VRNGPQAVVAGIRAVAVAVADATIAAIRVCLELGLKAAQEINALEL
jgi:hypothetical protein